MKGEWLRAKALFITADSFVRGIYVELNAGWYPPLVLRQNFALRMGKGAFPLFTLELCPAMLNPPAFISSLGHHLVSPSSRVMK